MALDDTRIEQWPDWQNSAPEYIEAPRIWSKGSFGALVFRFIGIMLSKPSKMTGWNREGNIYWSYKKSIMEFNPCGKVNYIYERIDGRYKKIDNTQSFPCSDCKGSGVYVGFTVKESCKKCQGNGFIIYEF